MTATNICYNFVGFRWRPPMVIIDTIDSFNEENGCRFDGHKKETSFILACLVNSCHGKDTGACIQTNLLNSSTHWHWM